MVLAFVGANIIQMQNALAVIPGSNLGTTFTSWIIATIGFSFNIESFALPVAGIFGIILTMSNKESGWFKWSKFFTGFGFLFLGLNFIKTGMEEWVKQTDLTVYSHHPSIVFLLVGFIITSLIQSSSATMAIALSALYTNAISLYAATAIALGSEIGTTIKLVLASLKGISAKKRVALGNLLFNIITSLIVFIFLSSINYFITEIIGIKDKLIALVFFQSLVNITGIILFYPFLNIFGRFLERRYLQTSDETLFIHKVKPSDADLALTAVENEIHHFIFHAIDFARQAFDRPADELLNNELAMHPKQKNYREYYDFLKHLHGYTHHFAVQLLNSGEINEDSTQRLQQLIAANRNTMYAAKNIKDAMPDINQLRNSSNDIKYRFYQFSASRVDDFCGQQVLLLAGNQTVSFEELKKLYKEITAGYSKVLQHLYKENLHAQLSEMEISTLLNFNRELYTAFKSLLFAAKDFLLNTADAAGFDELPGFIR